MIIFRRASGSTNRKRPALISSSFADSCDAGAACDQVEQVFGRRPARSDEYGARLPEFHRALRTDGAGYFSEFGLAIVDPRVQNIDPSALTALRGQGGVASVRPEYEVYSSGWLCRWLGLERSKAADAPGPILNPVPQPATTPGVTPGRGGNMGRPRRRRA